MLRRSALVTLFCAIGAEALVADKTEFIEMNMRLKTSIHPEAQEVLDQHAATPALTNGREIEKQAPSSGHANCKSAIAACGSQACPNHADQCECVDCPDQSGKKCWIANCAQGWRGR